MSKVQRYSISNGVTDESDIGEWCLHSEVANHIDDLEQELKALRELLAFAGLVYDSAVPTGAGVYVEAEVPRSVFNEAAKVIEENRMEKL